MKISIPENIGDEVTLYDSRRGLIISITISGPNDNIAYDISWWDNGSYKTGTFWRFEFRLTTNAEKKAGFCVSNSI